MDRHKFPIQFMGAHFKMAGIVAGCLTSGFPAGSESGLLQFPGSKSSEFAKPYRV